VAKEKSIFYQCNYLLKFSPPGVRQAVRHKARQRGAKEEKFDNFGKAFYPVKEYVH
jgi:hypothetical protein